MAFERAKRYLEAMGFADRIIVTDAPSPTVETAAIALGCEPGMIAKSLSFLLRDDAPALIIADGTARVDNRKFKDRFGVKARMIPADRVEALIGHAVGGVCPFGVNEGVLIYLDESLKRHAAVYPACGTDHSGVRLTVPELEQCCGHPEWVDVCKDTAM